MKLRQNSIAIVFLKLYNYYKFIKVKKRGKKYDSLIYNDRTITINFMATSPSISLFTRWQNLMFLQETSLNSGILSVTIYNLGKSFVFTTCALRNNQQIPNIQATLGEVEIIISCDTNAQVITL